MICLDTHITIAAINRRRAVTADVNVGEEVLARTERAVIRYFADAIRRNAC